MFNHSVTVPVALRLHCIYSAPLTRMPSERAGTAPYFYDAPSAISERVYAVCAKSQKRTPFYFLC